MTGQDLLNRMELLNQELQLQSGETDVTRGLIALNVAQDFFESLAAVRKILGDQTGTVTTSASTESTSFPSGLLRIDALYVLDSNNRPKRRVDPLRVTGGHSGQYKWPLSLATGGSGEPERYWTNGRSIYWDPLPSGTTTLRWYGFQTASDITAGGTFAYPDLVALPLAVFAAKILKIGLDDQAQDLQSVALDVFNPALAALALYDRDGAKGLSYSELHSE